MNRFLMNRKIIEKHWSLLQFQSYDRPNNFDKHMENDYTVTIIVQLYSYNTVLLYSYNINKSKIMFNFYKTSF